MVLLHTKDRKYPNGGRPNRAAASGYWKATGIDKKILSTTGLDSSCLGVKKPLIFYHGHPPKGLKTDWVMEEYRLLQHHIAPLPKNLHYTSMSTMRLDDFVLCRVRQKTSVPIKVGNEDIFQSFPSLAFSSSDDEDVRMDKYYNGDHDKTAQANTFDHGVTNQITAAIITGEQLGIPNDFCFHGSSSSKSHARIDCLMEGSREPLKRALITHEHDTTTPFIPNKRLITAADYNMETSSTTTFQNPCLGYWDMMLRRCSGHK